MLYWQDEVTAVLCDNDLLFCLFISVDLLGLLKWRSNTSLLQQNLRQLMKVEGGEVVKVRGWKSSFTVLTTLCCLCFDDLAKTNDLH